MKSFIEKTIISGTAFLIISSGTVFAATNPGAESFRNSLTEKEQIRLVKDENKYLSFFEAKEIARKLIESKTLAHNTVQGHFREGLDNTEKVNLILEEKRYLTPYDHRIEAVEHKDLETGNGYVHGEFRANLSEKERRVLENEERYGK